MSKTPEELAQDFNAKMDNLDTLVKNAASKEDLTEIKEIVKSLTEDNSKTEAIEKLQKSLVEQGEVIAKMEAEGKPNAKGKSITMQIKENKETLRSIARKDSNSEVVLKADTVRASITDNEQALDLTDIGQLAHKKLSAYDIFRKIPVSESNTNGIIRYYDWDADTTVRAAAAVAEGAVFPESTATWIKGNLTIEKIGDTLPVSEEFYEDEAMFAAELEMFLNTNVAIQREEEIINGDGTSNALLGIVESVPAYTPVASGISDASIYDLIPKLSAAITEPYGSKYQPDFALMNINDILKMQLKKDANENYVIPPFVSPDGKNVGGVIVLENNFITANTMVMGDRRYARIYEKAGVVLSRGMINAQFTEDMETLKARTRLAFLIRNVDKTGFLKVADIDAALVTLATAPA